MAILGLPLADWEVYCEPTHALVYTPPQSPEFPRVMQLTLDMMDTLYGEVARLREQPRPGLIDALFNADISGRSPDDRDIVQTLVLLIGGGFDTTTALTAHSLEYLGEHPDQRERLSRERDTLLASATEEFLRFFTPAPGNGRTISADCEIDGTSFREGDRVWLSWAMANRDPSVFPDPDVIDMERPGNRHASFGLGIHRCIGSNVARMVFKAMITAVFDRMPDYVVDPGRTVHYESIGMIQGMRHLAASFTPGPRLGPGLSETVEILQRTSDAQGLAQPAALRRTAARKEA
jgi:cytochrome P450